jgi:hypothetical protein
MNEDDITIDTSTPVADIPSIDTITIPDNFKLIFNLVTPTSSAVAHLQLSSEPKYNPYIALFGMYPAYVPKLTQAISVKDSLVFNKKEIFSLYCVIYHLDAKAFEKDGGVNIVARKVISNIVDVVKNYLANVPYKGVEIGVGFQLVECLNKKEFIHPIYTHPILNNANKPNYVIAGVIETSDGDENICYLTDTDGFTSKSNLACKFSSFTQASRKYKSIIKLLKELPVYKLFPVVKRTTPDYKKRQLTKYTLTILEEEYSTMVLGVNDVVNLMEDEAMEVIEKAEIKATKVRTKAKTKVKPDKEEDTGINKVVKKVASKTKKV